MGRFVACGVFAATFASTALPILLNFEDVEWNLDLDDRENFVTHPLLTHFLGKEGDLLTRDFAPGFQSTLAPVLGVVEPVSAVLRCAAAALLGRTPRTTYLFGCALHSSNAALLVFVLNDLSKVLSTAQQRAASAESTSTTQPLSGAAVAAASLVWSLHPTRGEVVGWLSCQSYLFATSFVLLSLLASLSLFSSRGEKRHTHFAWRYLQSIAAFALACGCKAVRWKSGRKGWCLSYCPVAGLRCSSLTFLFGNANFSRRSVRVFVVITPNLITVPRFVI
jgi:hypothetical protein